ncbi:MAG: hypothetical protein QHH04_04745 [Methanolinea sp.]|nr:hypothetical protein [Methanolinea sp.]
MKQGTIMLAAVPAVWLASVIALFGTPLFPLALAAGVLPAVSGLVVFSFFPDEAALFLFGQPVVFLSWYASPLLATALESVFIVAFLVSAGDTGVRRVVVPAIVLVSVSGFFALFISGHRHVLLPLVLLLSVCMIAMLAILGTASHLIHRVAGGLHEAPGRK